MHMSTMMMDHAAFGFSSTFSDGTPDPTSPHRPGFRFADTKDRDRIAANDAYQKMRERLSGKPQEDERVPTLDELEQSAVAAYNQRSERMRNAWKNRHG